MSERMSGKEYLNLSGKQKKRSKYGNKKVTELGMTFDSVAEYHRYTELALLQQGGCIKDLRRQVRFELLPKQKDENSAYYTADFEYIENGIHIVEDVKSEITAGKADYILRRKIFKLKYPDIVFRETIM